MLEDSHTLRQGGLYEGPLGQISWRVVCMLGEFTPSRYNPDQVKLISMRNARDARSYGLRQRVAAAVAVVAVAVVVVVVAVVAVVVVVGVVGDDYYHSLCNC